MSSTVIHVSKDVQKNTRSAMSKLYAKVRNLEMENKNLRHRLSHIEKSHSMGEASKKEIPRIKPTSIPLGTTTVGSTIPDEEFVKLLEEKESFYIDENDRLKKTIIELKNSQQASPHKEDPSGFMKVKISSSTQKTLSVSFHDL
jgi:hypothetical protein